MRQEEEREEGNWTMGGRGAPRPPAGGASIRIGPCGEDAGAGVAGSGRSPERFCFAQQLRALQPQRVQATGLEVEGKTVKAHGPTRSRTLIRKARVAFTVIVCVRKSAPEKRAATSPPSGAS